MLKYLLSLKMLQAYADLAARAIRRDFLKPRIQENDFSEVKSKRNGNMIVQNARFKTRIRASRQVRHTWLYEVVLLFSNNFLTLDAPRTPTREWGYRRCDD
jgi:hypothetical protein